MDDCCWFTTQWQAAVYLVEHDYLSRCRALSLPTLQLCLITLCAYVQAELAEQSWQQQAKETQLKENPSWPAINRLEQQLQQLQTQIDNAEVFIREHEEKANYRPLAAQIMDLVDAINIANIGMLAAA